MQLSIFPSKLNLPPGFSYSEDFLDFEEEALLLHQFQTLEFGEFVMHGKIARRKVAVFGDTYSRDTGEYRGHQAIPEFLQTLRKKVAKQLGESPAIFKMVLVTKYPPGAPIGWHSDKLPYGAVAGVSFNSAAIMRLRPVGGGRDSIIRLGLQPRSLYLMRDQARYHWQHSVLPVKSLRYAVTFRTIRSDGLSSTF